MRRLNVTSTVFLLSVTIILGYSINNWRIKAKGVRLHARDLPEHGLLIIAPTDPSFDIQLAKLIADKNGKQGRLIEALKPFSVFVKNKGLRDVIAYRMRWDVMQADGTVITHFRTYADPGLLMGRDEYLQTEGTRNAGFSIRANSERYISVASSTGTSQDAAEEPINMGGSGSNTNDIHQVQQIGEAKDETALIDLLSRQLAQAESMTVSLDVAIFDDGTFIGPDSSAYFDQLQAEVNAQKDLLQETLLAVQRNESLEKVFNDIEAITKEPSVVLRANSTPDDYYRFYRSEFASEILRIRAATGNDKQAMWYALRPLRKSSPKLHRARGKS